MRKKVITKELLLDIASKIIKQNDLEACSMRAVSREAGIGVGTLYNYYSSRDELLMDLFNKSWMQTIEDLDEISNSDDDVVVRFKNWSHHLINEVVSRKGLGKAVFGSVMDLGQKKLTDTSDVFSRVNQSLTKIIGLSELNKDLSINMKETISEWVLIALLTSVGKRLESYDELVDELVVRFVRGV